MATPFAQHPRSFAAATPGQFNMHASETPTNTTRSTSMMPLPAGNIFSYTSRKKLQQVDHKMSRVFLGRKLRCVQVCTQVAPGSSIADSKGPLVLYGSYSGGNGSHLGIMQWWPANSSNNDDEIMTSCPSGELLERYDVNHSGDVSACRLFSGSSSLSPKVDLFASGSSTGRFDLHTLCDEPPSPGSKVGSTPLLSLQLHQGACASVDYNPAQQFIVTAGEDGHINLLFVSDLRQGRQSPRTSLAADTSAIYSVLFPREMQGPIVLTAGASPSAQLQLWDLRQKKSSVARLGWQKANISQINQRFACGDGHFCLAGHPTRPELFASGDGSGNVFIWDVRKPSLGGALAVHQSHQGPVWGLAFHPSSSTSLISCGEDGTLVFNDTKRMSEAMNYNSRHLSDTFNHSGICRVVYRSAGALNDVAVDQISSGLFVAAENESLLYTFLEHNM